MRISALQAPNGLAVLANHLNLDSLLIQGVKLCAYSLLIHARCQEN